MPGIQEEVKADDPQKELDRYKRWTSKLEDAFKREATFRKEAKRCVNMYEAEGDQKQSFAILYSNTETLAPAVYNSRPIPRVDRRFKDADPVGKLASDAGTRLLKYLIDVESEEYDNFDELMQPAVLDTLITNRGLTRFKYEADTTGDKVSNECVYGEAVRYDKFAHGHARTWKKVPWVEFEHDMSPKEFEVNFPDKYHLCKFSEPSDSGDTQLETREQLSGVKIGKVYEIWDKASRKVIFISPCYPKGILKEVDDPLKLSSFFPCPKPLCFMKKVSTLVPTPLYVQYEQQASELNSVTVRLKHLISAAKLRGMYDATIQGIEKVLEAGDNDMIPVENKASMPENAGLDKALWLMPLGEIASLIQVLNGQREQIKSVIYEITGISDILRGASIASETATAQNIKNQWGTLRLKKLQKEVQRYCRDCLRLMLEIAVTKFGVDTISAMTGLPYPTDAQQAEARGKIQQVQQQAQIMMQQYQGLAQAAQQAGQQSPPPPQPAPPPPPQLQAAATDPTWEQVLGLLKNDVLRSYRIDIETNSTVDAEASQDKQDIAELLNAMSQFLNGIAPLIENGSMPFDVAKGILLAICRRYTFGPQLEDALEQMSAPQPPAEPAPPPPDPNLQVKMQAEAAKAQAQMAKSQQEMQQSQLDGQLAQASFEMEKELLILKGQIAQQELGLKQQQLEIDRAGLGMKAEFSSQQHQQKMAAARTKETSNAAV